MAAQSNIIHLASPESVDASWEAYAEKARMIEQDPTLLCNRSFNEELARLHERFRRLFIMRDGR